MATTDAEHLALINEVITKRLAGDGYESYTVQQRQFYGTKLSELYKIRNSLQSGVNTASGGGFSLIDPFCD